MKENIEKIIFQAIQSLKEKKTIDIEENKIRIQILNAKDKKHGDFSSNIAMQLAKQTKIKPMDLAVLLIQEIDEIKEEKPFSKLEAKLPGFLNFYLKSDSYYGVLQNILIQKNKYGFKEENSSNKKVLMEYVSANPTGPLTLAHARQAVVGDVIANLLIADGCQVTKEYYLNDRGLQIETLGRSIYLRYLECCGREVAFPEDAYQGDYIKKMALEIMEIDADKWVDVWNEEAKKHFSSYGKNKIMDEILCSLEKARVEFDNYFSEEKFSEGNAISEVLRELEVKNYTYQKDGALWLKSSSLGDDKDRVLIRSTGEMTYITPDIAYHKDKLLRGYDLLVNIWGPDHHGYIPRIRAAIEALGYDKNVLKVIILQLTTLYEGDNKISMSTRKGEYITQDEVIKEVGVDAARYFFCMRTTDSHLDFDLQLAKEETPDNPVYYIQYAHARICNIWKTAEQKGVTICTDLNLIDWNKLREEEEIELIKKLNKFQEVIHQGSSNLEPCKLTEYLKDLAKSFHSYYNKHRVISEDDNLMQTRLYLVECIRQVIENGLGLLKISAPQQM